MPLLADVVRRANPRTHIVVDLADTPQPQVVQMITRRERLHRVESRMLDALRENDAEDEVILAEIDADERHPPMKRNARFLREHFMRTARAYRFCERVEKCPQLGRTLREMRVERAEWRA